MTDIRKFIEIVSESGTTSGAVAPVATGGTSMLKRSKDSIFAYENVDPQADTGLEPHPKVVTPRNFGDWANPSLAGVKKPTKQKTKVSESSTWDGTGEADMAAATAQAADDKADAETENDISLSEEMIAEIGFAHELGEINRSDSEIIDNSKIDGKIGQREVYVYGVDNSKLFFFKTNNKIDAMALVTGDRLSAIKNRTEIKGLIYALVNYLINMKQMTLRVNAPDLVTAFGIDWLIKQITRQDGFKIRDKNGNKVDPKALMDELLQSKNSDDFSHSPTSLTIGESSKGQQIRDNEKSLIPYDIFGVNQGLSEEMIAQRLRKELDLFKKGSKTKDRELGKKPRVTEVYPKQNKG